MVAGHCRCGPKVSRSHLRIVLQLQRCFQVASVVAHAFFSFACRHTSCKLFRQPSRLAGEAEQLWLGVVLTRRSAHCAASCGNPLTRQAHASRAGRLRRHTARLGRCNVLQCTKSSSKPSSCRPHLGTAIQTPTPFRSVIAHVMCSPNTLLPMAH